MPASFSFYIKRKLGPDGTWEEPQETEQEKKRKGYCSVSRKKSKGMLIGLMRGIRSSRSLSKTNNGEYAKGTLTWAVFKKYI
jgi:hypothetical protein